MTAEESEAAVAVFNAEYLRTFPRGGDEGDHDDAIRNAVEAVVLHVKAQLGARV